MKQSYAVARRIVISVIGGTLVLLGILMLVTPGPGLAALAAGLGVLAAEFAWARYWLHKLREKAVEAGNAVGWTTAFGVTRAADAEAVLEFWLGSLSAEGLAEPERRARWFEASDEFDRDCRERFEELHTAVLGERCEGWLQQPRPCVAYVIVADQLSRNLYRGTPAMYAADSRALRAAELGLRDHATVLAFHERHFLYLPYMHAEDRAAQARCVALFEAELERATGPARREAARTALDFARRHRDIVERFGRFPHRNALLGRPSRPEELAFLEEEGSSF